MFRLIVTWVKYGRQISKTVSAVRFQVSNDLWFLKTYCFIGLAFVSVIEGQCVALYVHDINNTCLRIIIIYLISVHLQFMKLITD